MIGLHFVHAGDALNELVIAPVWVAIRVLKRVFECQNAGERPVSVLIAVQQDGSIGLGRSALWLCPAKKFGGKACCGSYSRGAQAGRLEKRSAGKHGRDCTLGERIFSTLLFYKITK